MLGIMTTRRFTLAVLFTGGKINGRGMSHEKGRVLKGACLKTNVGGNQRQRRSLWRVISFCVCMPAPDNFFVERALSDYASLTSRTPNARETGPVVFNVVGFQVSKR